MFLVPSRPSVEIQGDSIENLAIENLCRRSGTVLADPPSILAPRCRCPSLAATPRPQPVCLAEREAARLQPLPAHGRTSRGRPVLAPRCRCPLVGAAPPRPQPVVPSAREAAQLRRSPPATGLARRARAAGPGFATPHSEAHLCGSAPPLPALHPIPQSQPSIWRPSLPARGLPCAPSNRRYRCSPRQSGQQDMPTRCQSIVHHHLWR